MVKDRKNANTYVQFQQGRLIVEQFGEISLASLSPMALQMIFFVNACNCMEYEFAQKAITNQLVYDTFAVLRYRSNVITLEQIISASATYMKVLSKDEDESKLMTELELSGELLGGKYKYNEKFKHFKSKEEFMKEWKKEQKQEA